MIPGDIENGKGVVERLLRDEAAKRGIELAEVKWREISPTNHQLEIAAASGKKTYRDFKAEHLVGANTRKYHWRVQMKVIGAIVRLA